MFKKNKITFILDIFNTLIIMDEWSINITNLN